MHRSAIDSEVLTGTERNKRILISRINLTYSSTIFAFAINKSQKQTLEKIAVLLSQFSIVRRSK
jgi:hypothetical protein